MKPELKESRRLTGANLHWARPGAIIDVALEDGAIEPFIQAWQKAAVSLLMAVGRSQEKTCYRIYDGGASLLISAPIDVLYSMCELNEAAWEIATRVNGQGNISSLESIEERLRQAFAKESMPALLALQATAQEHGVPFLWDDDEVSVGYGKTSIVWPRNALPAPDQVNWSLPAMVPLALVTGTNGKSTTVRMTASIMTAAGYRAGLTSTDFIRVGERTIDWGDYSGTGGARTLLRQPDLEMAVMEVARGGLLRRGLGVEHAQVAVVTNVASDHLGEYGINSVEELIPAKFIVRHALHHDDPLILNADDEGILAYAASLDHRLDWFSLDAENLVLQAHLSGQGRAAYLKNGWLIAARPGESGVDERRVIRAADIPATRGGAARFNISNALAALSIAVALGIPDGAIRQGLLTFRGDETDNPGRGNWFEHKGVRILVDFAHNEHGMTALASTVRQLEAEHVVLLMGQAGDRSDRDIEGLTRAACSMNPDRLLICELPGYERGRKPAEVPGLIQQSALQAGLAADSIQFCSSPLEATRLALQEAKPGDLLVLLALMQRSEILTLIHEFLEDNG